jgi:post-segregation antitoxin (ccd killing protein)
MGELHESSTWKKHEIPRGKHHNKTATKTTVSLYLSKNLVKRAREHRLNISRVTEQALSSILDYLETQNNEKNSQFLDKASFPKKVWWTGRDLNPRPPRCQRGDHSKLIYPPNTMQTRAQEIL